MPIFRGEYIWIDGYKGLRSKTKIVRLSDDTPKANPENNLYNIFTTWNFDGSSTHQATTENSEVHLKPILILRDNIRTKLETRNSLDIVDYFVLCETFLDSDLTKPHPTNTRYKANIIMEKYADKKPLFGIEQEFFLFDNTTGRPLDWSYDLIDKSVSNKGTSAVLLSDRSTFPAFTSKHDDTGMERHYCGIGAGKVSSRRAIENVVNEALLLGFNITGMNYEVAPGQAEIQICEEGIKAADHLVILRYILAREMEKENMRVDISAKPIKNGEWNGSGCHVNFSTEEMRKEGGLDIIMKAMTKLAEKHIEHIECYGDDNAERLTGKNETSSMHKFSYGLGNRGASIRIPTAVIKQGFGYFEDRRPSGSMDPYRVTSKILETISAP